MLGSDLRGLLGFFRRYDRRAGRLAGLIVSIWRKVATIDAWNAAMQWGLDMLKKMADVLICGHYD